MLVNSHCIICFTGEKIVKPVCSSQLLPRNCDHQKLCSIIKTVLGLMGEFLSGFPLQIHALHFIIIKYKWDSNLM